MFSLKKFFKKNIPQKNKWFIAIKYRSDDLFDLKNLHIVQSPPNHYYADPFLVEHLGRTWLFFEDYDYKKGVISVAEIEGLTVKNPTVIIQERFHLSFPSVFEDNGQFYMTPESRQSKRIFLYIATAFPYKWKKVNLIAKGKFDDPIIKKCDQYYELYTTEGGDNLRIFRAKSLMGKWELVKSSHKQYSRSAGHFIQNIRPAQDLSKTYGGAIKFCDGNTVVHSIEPTWYPNLTGTHTFNYSKKYVVIDGRISI